MMYKFFVIFLIFNFIIIQSQQGKVGISTTDPTEVFDTNGTFRVRSLPLNGTLNSINTKPDGSLSPNKDQTFTAVNTVVADRNGILGILPGITNMNSVSQFKHITVIDNSLSDAIELQTGCLKLILDPYISSGEAYMTLKAEVLSGCSTVSNMWIAATETGGADSGGANTQQGYSRQFINTTTPTDINSFYHHIRYTPFFSGKIALIDMKQVYGFTYYGNKNNDESYDISLELRKEY